MLWLIVLGCVVLLFLKYVLSLVKKEYTRRKMTDFLTRKRDSVPQKHASPQSEIQKVARASTPLPEDNDSSEADDEE